MRKTTPKLYTRRSLQLTRPQADYLDAESERLGIAVGELIRRILDAHIERGMPVAGAHRNIRGLTDEDFERVIRGEKKNPDPRKGKARPAPPRFACRSVEEE